MNNFSDLEPDTEICLQVHHVFIALVLVGLMITTIVGNILIIISVIHYKRMRTFTNVLLVSLAIADLSVGVLVTPLALADLLYYHQWPFGRLVCRIWATTDVLLCTASILNLCAISLDRYLAITSPLKYIRTRGSKFAGSLIFSVWFLSAVICSPPWFVPEWQEGLDRINANSSEPYMCGYTKAVSYRIYSAMGSFYIPLLIMLFLYYRILMVASRREQSLNQGIKKGRPSQKMQIWYSKGARPKTLSPPPALSTAPLYQFVRPRSRKHAQLKAPTPKAVLDTTLSPPFPSKEQSKEEQNHVKRTRFESTSGDAIEMDDFSSIVCETRKNTANEAPAENLENENVAPLLAASKGPKRAPTVRFQAPKQRGRGAREKVLFQKERKALRTIGIVVCGFIACWLPFFILYLVEVALYNDEKPAPETLGIVGDFFLWLGYSNSALNPIIYTFYNQDFRRCFRDLVTFGCLRREMAHSRMSVRRLHQVRV